MSGQNLEDSSTFSDENDDALSRLNDPEIPHPIVLHLAEVSKSLKDSTQVTNLCNFWKFKIMHF